MKKTLHRDNLYDFFHGLVQEAAKRHPPPISDATTTYMAQLLVRLAQSEALLLKHDTPRTLAELHLQAREAPRERALRLYKHLGDYALTVAGYFGDSLRRRPVGVSYYADMGGAAYERVFRLSAADPEAARHDPWLGVFAELSRRFGHCRELLEDVAERNRAEEQHDLGRLYERFVQTGSAHAARRMTELGALPIGPQGDH